MKLIGLLDLREFAVYLIVWKLAGRIARPSWPTMSSSPASRSVMKTSFESTTARPSFSIVRATARSRSLSTRNSVIPANGFSGFRGSVRVSSSSFSALIAFVSHTFWPLITHLPPRRSARVSIREVSVPAFGSVTPKPIMNSPFATRGRTRCFSSSEPWWMIGEAGKM